jgi:hypothetical protein
MNPTDTNVASLLSRPNEQRAREHRYRCAQAIVFGLPVLALQWFGHGLGGEPDEARRWTAVLQALLAGWVTYIAAAGMLAEGVLLIGRRFTFDLLVAAVALLLYVVSLISSLGVLVRGRPLAGPLFFHIVVILLAGWCGWRWWQLQRAS